MKLIVGLGNPGPEYAKTRHNAGFMVIERLLSKHSASIPSSPKAKFHSTVYDGEIAGQRAMLLMPMTFMNRSGLAVGEAMTFHKIAVEDMLVLVDDIALPVGRIRVRAEGSAGGHNGLLDIERALGTKAYPRLRIGIDAPGRVPQRDYVLGRFGGDQLTKLDHAVSSSCDAVACWASEGIAKVMTKYNAD